jgi:hypothetical protein
MSDFHEGPPLIYVPICKHPRDFMFTFGPLGYELVEEVTECPLCVTPAKHKPERT